MDIDTHVENLLSSSKLLLNAPSQALLGSDLYSSVHNSQIELSKRNTYQGRYKNSANSLRLGAVSSFYLQPGTICQQAYVSGSLVMPQHARSSDGWMLNAIASLEIIVAGSSSIQSLRISGRTHFDMIMLSCSSREKRNEVLQCSPAFNLTAAGATIVGACPIYLPWSSPELAGCFAFDTSTIKSQIIINVTWKPAYFWASGSTGNPVTFPDSFSDLYLRLNNQVELETQFLAQSMMRNAALNYSIPGLYCQSFQTPVTLTAGVETQVALTSMPSGMLQAIALSIVPSTWEGSADTVSTYANSLIGGVLSSVRMLFNGQELVRWDNDNEGALQACLKNDNASSQYDILNTASVAAAATNVLYNNRVILLPFANEISKVLRSRRMEHTGIYSGSTLQVFMTLSSQGLPYQTSPIARAFQTLPTGISYNCNFTFICASLIEVNDASVSLQLS